MHNGTDKRQIIAIFYPETKGKTLEELDGLFDKLISNSDSEHGSESHSPRKMQDEGGFETEQHIMSASGKY